MHHVFVSAERFVADMDELGVDASGAASHMKEGKKRARSISKREPSVAADDDMADDGEAAPRPGFRSARGASTSRAPSDEPRSRSRSRARNASRGEPLPGEGFKDAKQKVSVLNNAMYAVHLTFDVWAVASHMVSCLFRTVVCRCLHFTH